jgi:hypothetical protein
MELEDFWTILEAFRSLKKLDKIFNPGNNEPTERSVKTIKEVTQYE